MLLNKIIIKVPDISTKLNYKIGIYNNASGIKLMINEQ